MRKQNRAERIILDELSETGRIVQKQLRGLSIGQLVAMIRKQLGMSQKILCERAGVLQSTLSRIERDKGEANLGTLKKILNAMSCDLLLVPILRETIDHQKRKQARRKAEKHVRYLKGTMGLEEQEPDSRFLQELTRDKAEEWLHSKKKLWDPNDE